jgi:thiosulfate/3-mercaptopyruvate sulfurtransferase
VQLRTLIGTEQLANRLADPGLVIVDTRFDLKDTSAGERAFADAHIPGARYAHLDRDLSGEKTGTNGRHPLPDADRFGITLGRMGIGNTSRVVVYDQDSGMFASRFWWMLRWVGHDEVAVLDGGFARWIAEGRPATRDVAPASRTIFRVDVRPGMLMTLDEMTSADPERRMLDARSGERYRGEAEPIDKAAGHIPGAVNHPFLSNLRADGTFESPEALRAHFADHVAGAAGPHIVNYCGSGVTACQNVLALEHAGITGTRLYAGSWSEWSADPGRPIETGDRASDAARGE